MLDWFDSGGDERKVCDGGHITRRGRDVVILHAVDMAYDVYARRSAYRLGSSSELPTASAEFWMVCGYSQPAQLGGGIHPSRGIAIARV